MRRRLRKRRSKNKKMREKYELEEVGEGAD
jgi:hypothetical protein